MHGELKRFEVQPFRPDQNKSGIFLFQSCRGLAHGPSQKIHYITTVVGPCVAVALTGFAEGERYPMIEFAHLDEASGPKVTVAELAYCAQQDFGGKFLPSKAYILNGTNRQGINNPALYRPLLERLEEAGFDCYMNVVQGESWLTIDLEAGLPVQADMDSFSTYVPNGPAYDQFMQYVETRPRTPLLLPAFDLTKPVPPFYELYKKPEAPRFAPHPSG